MVIINKVSHLEVGNPADHPEARDQKFVNIIMIVARDIHKPYAYVVYYPSVKGSLLTTIRLLKYTLDNTRTLYKYKFIKSNLFNQLNV